VGEGGGGGAVLLLDGLMADEFPALEDRLAYARRVNRLGCEVMLDRDGAGEQGVSGS